MRVLYLLGSIALGALAADSLHRPAESTVPVPSIRFAEPLAVTVVPTDGDEWKVISAMDAGGAGVATIKCKPFPVVFRCYRKNKPTLTVSLDCEHKHLAPSTAKETKGE